MSMNDALCYHGRYLSICSACRPDVGFGPLFDEPRRDRLDRLTPRLHHDVATCQAEERRQRRDIRGRGRAILTYLRAHGPHTRAELAEGTGIRIQSVCSTVDALKRQAFVVQTDEIRDGGHLLAVVP